MLHTHTHIYIWTKQIHESSKSSCAISLPSPSSNVNPSAVCLYLYLLSLNVQCIISQSFVYFLIQGNKSSANKPYISHSAILFIYFFFLPLLTFFVLHRIKRKGKKVEKRRRALMPHNLILFCIYSACVLNSNSTPVWRLAQSLLRGQRGPQASFPLLFFH